MNQKTGIVETKIEELTKFDYNVKMLEECVADAKAIDRTDIVAVKDMHKKFVKIRTGIKSQEEALVAGLNKQKNYFFDQRKQFLEITMPVEEELKVLLEAEKQREIIELRRESLPIKRKQLALLEMETEPTDDELLAMDSEAWGIYYTDLIDAREARIAKEKQDIIDAEEKEKREAKIAEDARLEGIAEAKQAQERKEKEEADQKEKDRIAEEARIENERLTKIEDAKKLKADAEYQAFLIINKFDEVTDRVVEKDGVVRIYRLVAEYQRPV